MTVTIWHNPKCGTSRKVLAMIRASGVEPEVIAYLNHPPPAETIRRLAAEAGLTIRQLLRQKEAPFAELGLGDPALSDAQLLDAVAGHPVLLERPLVRTPRGTRLCRPAEAVLDLLDPAPAAGGAPAGAGAPSAC
ncbi:arsenate reductase (glutaredoxin) [Paracoccus contaminans]|uniref:Arsenate reductase n=1 Tax=Paracoccus contaminans TaxID=1945662 RepID=A0A1W6CYK1_9RHOB|nr:arsenate reductase (glutaredoxin) [Paracoccus contaminans]ARJ69915.1 arsenate reductase (glutaredoxin) [Paracoccus contaminans]